MAPRFPSANLLSRLKGPLSLEEDKPHHLQRGLRLIALIQELAASGNAGKTPEELLASQALQPLYSTAPSAARQALRRDLILLSGTSLRAHKRNSGEVELLDEQFGSLQLVKCDHATKRYSLAIPTGPLRLSTEALEALCTLASALEAGKKIPGGPDLFKHLTAMLPQDQQATLQAAMQGRPYGRSALRLNIDLPDMEQADLEKLAFLKRAIEQHFTVSFEYLSPHSRSGVPKRHSGDEVLELSVSSHAYVVIWCQDAQRELFLRLDRIILDSLERHPRQAITRPRQGVKIRYSLSPQIASQGVSLRVQDPSVEYQPDGSVIVSGIVHDLFWAKRLLLPYGQSAHALDPPALVEEMRREIHAMAARYEP